MSKIILTVAALAFLVSTASAVKAGSLDCKTPCSKEQCGVQKCDMDVPYACVAGTAKGGCSNKPLAFANTSSCTACCDISSCAISCDKCTAEQCKHNSCTSKVPYLCTNGSDQGGCAASSSSWKVNPGCSACCDTSSCPTTTAAPGGPSPTSVPLNCDQDCGSFCHSQDRCPFATPYMCIAGPGKDGCSASKGAWSSPSCTSCCDVTKCPQTPCGSCSATVCANTLCSLTNPYICTGGALNGGCSPLSTFWPQSPECTSCCNYNTCPQPSGSNSGSN